MIIGSLAAVSHSRESSILAIWILKTRTKWEQMNTLVIEEEKAYGNEPAKSQESQGEQ